MCVHAYGSVWVWNHDGWRGEEQRAAGCVHQDSVHLHPSPVNAAAAALRLWDTLLMSQWILGDSSCRVAEFKPCMYAIHNSIFILPFAFIFCSFSSFLYLDHSCLLLSPSFIRSSLALLLSHFPPILSPPFSLFVYPILFCLLRPFSICLLVCSCETSSVTTRVLLHFQIHI